MSEELIYWIALSQVKNLGIEKINKVIVKVIHEQKELLSDLFHSNDLDLKRKYDLSEKEIFEINEVKKELPKYSFLTEDLLAQGYEVITIDSPKYSKTLKQNLKMKSSPPIVYVKGNTQLLQENSIAIVGSRDAEEISLKFADNIAKNASKNFKVIVSGFAKGIDKQALDSAIKHIGQSIIVLPQGIMTFSSGFNKYYKEIQSGDVLVLSTFFPKAPWSAQLAMARNPIIYGLAKEIYVAQSSDKGGTWAGVIDGLRKGREIFVRLPNPNESNANSLLIQKGATPVDFDGNILTIEIEKDNNLASIERSILELLKKSELSSAEIKKYLKLDWSTNKMTSFLKNMSDVQTINSKPLKFIVKADLEQNTLF